MIQAVVTSLLAGLATGFGALPVLTMREVPRRWYDSLLGFAAGIMLAASSFSLLGSALAQGELIPALGGLAAGAFFVFLLERALPHMETHFSPEPLRRGARQGFLMAVAVALHNFPEGFAVGAGFGASGDSLGLILALGIAIQNIPEGLAVASPLISSGYSRWRTLLLATASGLTEPVAALFGVSFTGISAEIMPFGLGFAAGAMIWVVCDELIPESHSHGNEQGASWGIVAGFILMITIQNWIG